ncbi:8556_t:CDS:2 [Funneliformis caledonium]|uniref:8556_t:CDS:1 n=1 Tax=Funneliformis caledonium TaxID=1117310 RepID=A0A9N8W253_9GLOM|nr:8556_t:CDS:2 [Funneliformis caledonium]
MFGEIETPVLHPSHIAGSYPWKGSLHHKQLLLGINNLSTLIVVTRDRDGGIILSLKILVSAGAKQVGTAQAGIEDFFVNELGNVEESSFLKYLEKVEDIGLTENRTFIGTAHQMGTCRMGDHPLNSVVDPQGKVWRI